MEGTTCVKVSESLGLAQRGRGRNLVVFLQAMGSHGRLLSKGSSPLQPGPLEKARLPQRGQAGKEGYKSPHGLWWGLAQQGEGVSWRLAGKETREMGEEAGLREKATHSRLSADRTGGRGSTSQQEGHLGGHLKGAFSPREAPPCNGCSQNFSDGKLTTCH